MSKRYKTRANKRAKQLLNIPQHIRLIFNIRELFDYIFSFVDYFYKIQFRSVSIQCKKWLDQKLLNNVICDDLDEMIRRKKTKVVDNRKINLDDHIAQNYLIIFSQNKDYGDYTMAGKFLVQNKCYSLMSAYVKKIIPNYQKYCYFYKKLCIDCDAINNQQTMLFINKFIKIKPCYNCSECKLLTKNFISFDDVTYVDKYYLFFLRAAARYGSINFFVKIYDQTKNIVTKQEMITELNTSLMAASYFSTMKCVRYVNQKIQKKSKQMLENDYRLIIKFCIDHDANPYIKVNDKCSLDLLDKCNHAELITYVIDHSKKYFDPDFFRNLVLFKIDYRLPHCTPQEIYFYEKYVEPDDLFLSKISKIKMYENDSAATEYLKLFNRFYVKKLGVVSINDYFDYLISISDTNMLAKTTTMTCTGKFHPINYNWIEKKINIRIGRSVHQ